MPKTILRDASRHSRRFAVTAFSLYMLNKRNKNYA